MIAFNLQRPSSTPLNGPNSGCGAFETYQRTFGTSACRGRLEVVGASLDETSMILNLDIHASTFANLAGNSSEKRNITSLTVIQITPPSNGFQHRRVHRAGRVVPSYRRFI